MVVTVPTPAPTGTHWIIASNSKTYDPDRAFEALREVNWSETASAHIALGDVVYLYGTKPLQAITHECLVVGVGVPFEGRVDDAAYWTDRQSLQDRRQRPWMRLRLMRTFEHRERSLLSLDALIAHGLKGAPQGRMKAPASVSQLIEGVAVAGASRSSRLRLARFLPSRRWS